MKYKLEIKPEVSNILTKNNKKVSHLGNCSQTYTLSHNRLGYVTGFSRDEEGTKAEAEFEKKLSLAPGTLSPYSNYWKSFFIHIPPSGLVLDDDSPLDALYIQILKADKEVANSMVEYEDNPSRFLFILKSNELESTLKNKKRELRSKAYQLYTAMSLAEKRNALLLYNKGVSIIEAMSPSTIDAELGDEMDADYSKFIKIAQDPKIKIKAEIINYINKNIIQKGTNKSTYDQELYFNNELIGVSLEEAATYLLSTKNSKVLEAIVKRFKSE